MERLAVTMTTVSEGSDHIARLLVEEKLAACVQLDQISSVYNWGGRVNVDQETRLTIKHLPRNTQALRSRLEEIHPYEVPEIITWEVQPNPPYLGWCKEVSM